MNTENIDWEKNNGLIPAIIQDKETQQVLMLGYMNQESLKKTYETGHVTFYSRTKKRLWMKGETSNHTLKVIDIFLDCDQDTLLILVKPHGPTCHRGTQSCFSENSLEKNILLALEKIIQTRYDKKTENSYTTQLFNAGIYKIAQKIGEEGVEVALASVSGSKENTIYESADLIYHLLVLLKACQIDFKDVLLELKNRMRE